MSRRKDTYYHKAKESGLRSRASFKILEIQEKFELLREGDLVLEIGSSPGGWTQIIREITGETVVSVDIEKMEPIEGIIFIKSNVFNPELEDKLRNTLLETGRDHFDVILSDAMVKTSGDRNIDHSSSYLLCRRVMELGEKFLDQGGKIVVKQFQGDMTEEFFREWGRKYKFKKKTSPKASRSGSSELYIIFAGKKKGTFSRQQNPGSSERN